VSAQSAIIIDSDHDFALMVGAPLQSEGLSVSFPELEDDPMELLKRQRPDLVVVRAEGRGSESGFALVGRIKNNRRFRRTAVLLYTADPENQPALDAHQQQSTPADGYAVLPNQPPYKWEDLKTAAKSALARVARDDVPPPLPSELASESPRLSPEDQELIGRIVDEPDEAPSPVEEAPAGRARRATADAKLDRLRQQLRQKESEVAKYKELFRAKEREYHQWNEKLVEKDVELQGLRMQVEELSRALEETRAENDKRSQEQYAAYDGLQEEKILRENELIQVVAEKEKELADTKGELGRTRENLEETSRRMEARVNELEESLAASEAHAADLEARLQDRKDDIGRLQNELADRDGRIQVLESTQAENEAELERRGETIEDQARLLSEVRGELSEARDASDEARMQQREAEVVHRDATAALRSQLDEAQAMAREKIAGLEAELEAQRADAERQAAEQSDALSSKEAELAGLFEDIEQLRARHEETSKAREEAHAQAMAEARQDAESERQALESELRSELDRSRAEANEQIAQLADLNASLEAQLAEETEQHRRDDEAARTRIEGLSAERDELQARLAQTEEKLSAEASQRSETAAALEERAGQLQAAEQKGRELAQALAEAQSRFADASERLKQTNSELSQARETLAQREGRLSELHEAYKFEQKETENAHKQLEELRGRFDQRGAEIGRLEGRVGTLEQQEAALRAASERALQERDEARQEGRKTVAELQSLKEARDELARTLEAKERELGTQTGRADEAERSLAQAKQAEAEGAKQLEELENRYFRELEEMNDDFMQQLKESDEQRATEVDGLRKELLDAKRALKTLELEKQQLKERVTKAEASAGRSASLDDEFEAALSSLGSVDGLPSVDDDLAGFTEETTGFMEEPPPRAAGKSKDGENMDELLRALDGNFE